MSSTKFTFSKNYNNVGGKGNTRMCSFDSAKHSAKGVRPHHSRHGSVKKHFTSVGMTKAAVLCPCAATNLSHKLNPPSTNARVNEGGTGETVVAGKV